MTTIEAETPLGALRSGSTELRVTVVVGTGGKQRLELREWFQKNGEMRPGSGIRLKPTLLPDLADLIALALTKARAKGMIK
jgi:hypothetical protein